MAMVLSQSQYTVGSSVAQGVIGAYDRSVKIDGRWGQFTETAFQRLPADKRALVASAVATVVPGSVPADFAAFRTSEKLAAARLSLSTDRSDVLAIIRAAAAREGVPYEAAVKFATLESNLNPDAHNASGATGLFQIMRVALADVNKIYGAHNGKQFTMGDMRDPVMNATVGVQYMKIAARYAGVPLSDVATVYMAYNIGAGNLNKLRRGQYNDPAASKAVMSQSARYGRNPKTYIATVSGIVNGMQVA